LLASKPIQIHLESSDDDDDEQTYTQQGLVGVFTFEANANGDHLQMVDYYWAKEHYDGSKIDGDSLKETEAEIKSCHDDQHPPDYLRNITNIIYPGGMPSPVKTSINEMHVHVLSQTQPDGGRRRRRGCTSKVRALRLAEFGLVLTCLSETFKYWVARSIRVLSKFIEDFEGFRDKTGKVV